LFVFYFFFLAKQLLELPWLPTGRLTAGPTTQVFANGTSAQVWPSVPGCIFFGSILVRHRLTPGPTTVGITVVTNWLLDQGSSLGN